MSSSWPSQYCPKCSEVFFFLMSCKTVGPWNLDFEIFSLRAQIQERLKYASCQTSMEWKGGASRFQGAYWLCLELEYNHNNVLNARRNLLR